ncbi:hypothetical protein [Nonomuraea sp. NPDC049309]|jgi:hypothetical protein|uniref:hypothetical protein n=1 Tax=Nonomuraea sp. NPDC049309 TaxID=3364350 RepID=UPI003720C773
MSVQFLGGLVDTCADAGGRLLHRSPDSARRVGHQDAETITGLFHGRFRLFPHLVDGVGGSVDRLREIRGGTGHGGQVLVEFPSRRLDVGCGLPQAFHRLAGAFQ